MVDVENLHGFADRAQRFVPPQMSTQDERRRHTYAVKRVDGELEVLTKVGIPWLILVQPGRFVEEQQVRRRR